MPSFMKANLATGEMVPMTQAEIDQWNTDQAEGEARRETEVRTEQDKADARSSGIAHALSLGFTQAQAEAMFP